MLNSQAKRIFISYKRNASPDEPVALQVFQALSPQHKVFIDQTMSVGTRWAECIEAEIRQADFLIIFLSALSICQYRQHGEAVESQGATVTNSPMTQNQKSRLMYFSFFG
ncbi:MAG: toll/interleukin-1 receptor domain-containing protein [Nostoc sp.]